MTATVSTLRTRKPGTGRNRPEYADDKGLFRSTLAGSGRSLREAFARIRNSDRVDKLIEHPIRPLLGARVNLLESEGKGHWNFLAFGDDLFLVVCDHTYIDPRLERLPGDGLLEFHIKLSGHLKMTTSRPEPILVDGPSLLVWNQPDGCEADEETGPGTPEKSITVYCSPEYIIGSLLGNADVIPAQLSRILFNDADGINYCQVPLNADLMQASQTMFEANSKMKDELWLVYAESKAIQLLCMIVSAFEQLSSAADETYSAADLHRFRQGQKILSKQFDPPPTIAQLAGMLATNETKLKNGFKSLYGMTIFEYRHRCRMQRALELLDTTELPVGLVSERIGYQHQTTFTTAFRNYFGFCPKDVRKLHRSVD